MEEIYKKMLDGEVVTVERDVVSPFIDWLIENPEIDLDQVRAARTRTGHEFWLA